MEYTIITPENLQDQKISDIFESCLYDLEEAKKAGIGINMSNWVSISNCTVCLGGAALLGFCETKTTECVNASLTSFDFYTPLRILLDLLDDYRKGHFTFTARSIKLLLSYPVEEEILINIFRKTQIGRYYGTLNEEEIKNLKKQIRNTVKELRKKGY